MDRSTAEKLVDLFDRALGSLNEATEVSGGIVDLEERRAVRRVIAEALMLLGSTGLSLLCRDFPDLHPDKDQPWHR
jgi:hypothetical protein